MTTADLKPKQLSWSVVQTSQVQANQVQADQVQADQVQEKESGAATPPITYHNSDTHPATPAAASWQITFGDLLTLLLCFAALAVRADTQNGSATDGQSQYNQIVTEYAAPSVNLSAAGTALATIETGSAQIQSEISSLEDGSFLIIRSNERALELVIGIEQLDPRSLQLWDFAYSALVTQLDSLVGREVQLTVAECSTGLSATADAGARHKRAIELRRQLADTYGSSAVGIASLGSGCESLENAGMLGSAAVVLKAQLKTQ